MTTPGEDLVRDYRAALLRYLPRREEEPLSKGYEIGRAAVADGVSVLDLAAAHHQVLVEILASTSTEDISRVATSASEFFLAVLATADLSQRAFLDGIAEGRRPA